MPINDILSSITGEPSPTSPSAPSFPSKRKATNDLPRPMDKSQRINSLGGTSNSGRSSIQSTKASTPTSNMAALKLAPKASSRDPPAAINNGHPTPPPTSDAGTTKAPKKGSFAEIMARGKMAQQTLGQVGRIQHKKIEKVPSRKEREEMNNLKVANIQKNLGPNGKFKSAMPTSSGNSKSTEKVMFRGKPVPVPEKKIKKAAVATTGYTGTARPRPDGAKPTSKPNSFARGPDRYRDQRRSTGPRYVSEEDEEEDIEEEDNYGSDASSDMEAAGWEVDDEEEEAARIARREDAAALAEENRLKREKLEKKRRLEALAKKRR